MMEMNAIALTRLSYFNLGALLQLYKMLGSATAVMEHRNHIEEVIPDASPRLKEGLRDMGEAMRRAEMEMEFNQQHGVRALPMNDPDYPQRLRECADAPIVLFYKGTADLNKQKVINIVGTRRCTIYGQDLVRQFVSDLRLMCPNVLIVSGLAYGIDIHAHRNALQCGLETVGVLAHGMDELYPPRHRDTAKQMLTQGGLLTEFMTHTNADKKNFVRRNRIVAGMSDACILVESAAHGGGLITADISRSYHRDVFAFPGRAGDYYSEGCNNLIRDNGAALINGADDFVRAMGWQTDAQLQQAQEAGIERQLFPDLSAEEKAVVSVLQQQNDQQANQLSVLSGLPIYQLTPTLFQLEMKGVIRTLAGGTYHLLT